MDAQSQKKVINAGFLIFCCDDQPKPRIKIKDSNNYEWRTYERFDTKAARDRRFNELLKEPEHIMD